MILTKGVFVGFAVELGKADLTLYVGDQNKDGSVQGECMYLAVLEQLEPLSNFVTNSLMTYASTKSDEHAECRSVSLKQHV